MRFIKTGALTLGLGVSLGILILQIHPFVLAARLVLAAGFVLVGLEVVFIGVYQLATGILVPTTRWTSFLLGVRPPRTPPSARQAWLVGGLLVLGGLLAFFTAATVWSSP